MSKVIMSRQYRIRVYEKQRKNIDPALLAQVVILFSRHLQQQQQRRHAAEDATAGRSPSASARRSTPVVTPPSGGDTAPRTSREGEGDKPDDGRGVQ
jgi:hypothetical protein